MIKQSSRRNCIRFLAAVEVHEHLGGSTGHAKVPRARMNVMATGQEVGVQGWIMKQSLEDNRLVACLSHIPHATSTTARARILVRVVSDVDLGC